MRLAILQQSYGRFGGAERAALSHFHQLKKRGVDVTLFYSGRISSGWLKRIHLQDVHMLPSRPNSFGGISGYRKFLVRMNEFDKIVVHHHVEPTLALALSRIYGKKTIWYSGSMFELAWEKFISGLDYRAISPTVEKTSSEFYGKIHSRAFLSNRTFGSIVQFSRAIDVASARGFSKIVANSKFLSRFLTRIYKLKSCPAVVYPGTDPMIEELSSRMDSSVIEEDAMMVVGPLIPLKNIEGVIRAASFVPSAKVVLIGDGQEKNNLKELASKLGVLLEFGGAYLDEEDLAAAYSKYSVLVHLSLYEPFGLTPIEAGLFSKPSIVTSHGGPAETVVNGETGFVVDPHDTRLIALRMRQLLENPQLRQEMGRKARINVLTNFSLESSTKNLLAEIE